MSRPVIEILIEEEGWREIGMGGNHGSGGEGLKSLVRQAALAAFAVAAGENGEKEAGKEKEIAICLGGDEQVQRLNRLFRGKDQPTNVLSFPDEGEFPGNGESWQNGPPGQPLHLGDIILSRQTVMREAQEQAIALHHHLAHLVIHGVLHLLGHDHMEEAEAERMERLEQKALQSLGLPSPFTP